MVKNIRISDLLRVTRSYNLLIILITQYLVYIYLLDTGQWSLDYILHFDFFMLAFSTIAVAAAGYIINDYHDIKIDMINKPERVVVGNSINRRIALVIYGILTLAGVVAGLLLSWKIGAINALAAGLLWFYSIHFKKVAFWGNISIAILTALSILIIYVWQPYESSDALIAYAWFAFIITLIREIIKDMEDMKGDKFYGCKTLPIIYGIARTSKILYLLIGIMCVSLATAFIYTSDFALKIFAVVILFQLSYLAYCISYTDTVKGFHKLGSFCKLIMITGILALLFF